MDEIEQIRSELLLSKILGRLVSYGGATVRKIAEERQVVPAEEDRSPQAFFGAMWQLHLGTAFGMLDRSISAKILADVDHSLPGNIPKDPSWYMAEQSDLEAFSPADREIELRRFISLDEEFVADREAQMLAVVMWETRSVTIPRWSSTGGIEGANNLGAAIANRMMDNFPLAASRLICLDNDIANVYSSDHSVWVRIALEDRFRAVRYAANAFTSAERVLQYKAVADRPLPTSTLDDSYT